MVALPFYFLSAPAYRTRRRRKTVCPTGSLVGPDVRGGKGAGERRGESESESEAP